MATAVYSSAYQPHIVSLESHFYPIGNETIHGITLKRHTKGLCMVCKNEHDINEYINTLFKSGKNILFTCTGDRYHSVKLEQLSNEPTSELKPDKKDSKGDMSLLLSKQFDEKWTREIRTERWLGDLPDRWKMLVVMAKLGRGKTTSMVNWAVKHGKDKKLLFPICRTVNGGALRDALIVAGFEGEIVLYSEILGGQPFIDCKVLIVQVESLHRIPPEWRKDYVVFMDESEGILAEFSSSTMNGKRADCYKVLCDCLADASGILLMDALMGGRSIAWATAFAKTRRWKPHVILHEPILRPEEVRVAIDMKTWLRLVGVGIRKLRQGKKVALVCASVEKLMEFVGIVKEQLNIDVLYYTSGSNGVRRKDLDNVNAAWYGAVCIAHSPFITVGLSYTIDAFDVLLVWGSTCSCVTRDLVQSMHRIRQYNEREVYFALYDEIPQNTRRLRCTLYSQRGRARWETKLMKEKESEYGLDTYLSGRVELPKCVLENEVWNRLEQDLNKIFYRELLIEYFERCGIRMANEEDNVNISGFDSNIQRPISIEIVPEMSYDEIGNVASILDSRELQQKVVTKQATTLELARWSKIQFLRLIRSGCPEECKQDLYDNLWRDKKKKCLVENIVFDLTQKDVRKELYKSIATEGRDVGNNRILKLIAIREICTSLGIENPYERVVIRREKIEKLEGVNITTIRLLFNIRFRGKDTPENAFRNNRYLISKVFSIWCGSTVSVEDDNRSKQGVQRLRNENGILNPLHLDLFNSLTEF